MTRSMTIRWRSLCRAAILAVTALAACGGGDEVARVVEGAASCELPAQKQWLRDYMQDWYYWSGASPNPEPEGFASVSDYFTALLYPGDGAGGPQDLWSYVQPTAQYQRHFGAGQSLGYGVFVSGLEGLPLKVRHVEPLSPAGRAGIARGDEVVAVNGRSAADVVAADDFAALSAAQVGDAVTVDLATAGGPRSVTLAAQVFDLTPMPVSSLLTLPDGRLAGYLMLKDFIAQAQAPLQTALTHIRSAGATELIIDLRYNGGGLVSTANTLASLIVGGTHAGQTFAQLRYNARHAQADRAYQLVTGPSPAFGRVVVIAGERTCSASELLINGLKPYANVVTIGGASCGKPFGFVSVQSCESTYSAVNFESFNAAGQGRYYGGIAPTCAVAEDFEHALGDPAEKLTAAALAFLDTGACPAATAADREAAAAVRSRRASRGSIGEPGQWRGMWAD